MIMNKISIVAILLTAGVAQGIASPVTPEQALSRLESSGPAKICSKLRNVSKELVYTSRTELGSSVAYVFNCSGGGYIVAPGDDIAYPLLGYSDEGSIDPDNISPELRWWLSQYTDQIDWALKKGVRPAHSVEVVDGGEAIKPLLTTKWDQGAPYNSQCPTPRNSQTRTVTGCVATSMAQVMNYHKYPEIGEGTNKYYASTLGRDLSMNFARESFDWENMLDTYNSGQYTEEEANAVGYLMKCCGYSTDMDYGVDMSGTQGYLISHALTTYFKYDGNCQSEYRMYYSASQWRDKIYNNLKNAGPVILNGQSPLEGGHSFVCDGYDGKGYFHFNWGWSGISDGYYLLDALNPEAQGTGGAAGGFNFSQNAIFGIQPPTGEPVIPIPDRLMQYGNSIATVDGHTVTFDVDDYSPLGWGNGTSHAIKVYIGLIINKINGDTQYVKGKLGNMDEVSLDYHYSYFPNTYGLPKFELPDLEDGTYTITLASKAVEGDSEWLPVMVAWGYNNSVKLEVNDGVYSVESIPVSTLTLTDLQLCSELYNARNALFKIHIENSSDIELSQGICPLLMDKSGKIVFSGESSLVSVMPGEKMDYEWNASFEPLAGAPAITGDTEFTLILRDPMTNLIYDGISLPVTMHKSPSAATVYVSDVVVGGSELVESYTYEGTEFSNVYRLESFNKPFEYSFKLAVSRGYMDGVVTVGIYTPSKENPNTVVPVVDDLYRVMPFMDKGESMECNVPVSFEDANPGQLYFLTITYASGRSSKMLYKTPFTDGKAGAVDAVYDGEGMYECQYYDVYGRRLENPEPGQIVIAKKGSQVSKLLYR